MEELLEEVDVEELQEQPPQRVERKLSRLRRACHTSPPRDLPTGQDKHDCVQGQPTEGGEDGQTEHPDNMSDSELGSSGPPSSSQSKEESPSKQSDAPKLGSQAERSDNHWDEEDELENYLQRRQNSVEGDDKHTAHSPAGTSTASGSRQQDDEDSEEDSDNQQGGSAQLLEDTQRVLRESAVHDRIGKGEIPKAQPMTSVLQKLLQRRQMALSRASLRYHVPSAECPPVTNQLSEQLPQTSNESGDVILMSDDDEVERKDDVVKGHDQQKVQDLAPSSQALAQAADSLADPSLLALSLTLDSETQTGSRFDLAAELACALGKGSHDPMPQGDEPAPKGIQPSRPDLQVSFAGEEPAAHSAPAQGDGSNPVAASRRTEDDHAGSGSLQPPLEALEQGGAQNVALEEHRGDEGVTDSDKRHADQEMEEEEPLHQHADDDENEDKDKGKGEGEDEDEDEDEKEEEEGSEVETGDKSQDEEEGEDVEGSEGGASVEGSESGSDDEGSEPELDDEARKAAMKEALREARAALRDRPRKRSKRAFFEDEAELSEDEGHHHDSGDDDDDDDDDHEALLADLIGHEKDGKRDEGRRAALHAKWLEDKEEDSIKRLMRGVQHGFRSRRALGSDYLDDEGGTHRDARYRRAAMMRRGEEASDDDDADSAESAEGSDEDDNGRGTQERRLTLEDVEALSDDEGKELMRQYHQQQVEEDAQKEAAKNLKLLDDDAMHVLKMFARSAKQPPTSAPGAARQLPGFAHDITNQAHMSKHSSFVGLGSSLSAGGITGSTWQQATARSYVFGREDSNSAAVPDTIQDAGDERRNGTASTGPTSFAGLQEMVTHTPSAAVQRAKVQGLLGLLGRGPTGTGHRRDQIGTDDIGSIQLPAVFANLQTRNLKQRTK